MQKTYMVLPPAYLFESIFCPLSFTLFKPNGLPYYFMIVAGTYLSQGLCTSCLLYPGNPSLSLHRVTSLPCGVFAQTLASQWNFHWPEQWTSTPPSNNIPKPSYTAVYFSTAFVTIAILQNDLISHVIFQVSLCCSEISFRRIAVLSVFFIAVSPVLGIVLNT